MKKIKGITLAIILTGVISLGSSGTAYSQKTTVLQFESWLPTNIAMYPSIQAFYKGLENATGGAVKVQLNMGGSMGKAGDTYHRTLQGVNDIGHFNPGFNTGVFPMWEIFEYPVHCPSTEQLARFQIAMYDKGYFDKEFGQVKIVGLYNVGAYILYSNQKITTINDLNRLKIRTPSQGWVATCKAIGAVPVTLPTGEMYLALQKGIVDAVANIWDAVRVFKLKEVSRYVNELYLMTTTHVYAMNKKTWEALPKAGKDYINANWKDFSLKCARSSEVLIPEFKKEFLSAGSNKEIAGFAPGELEKLDKLLKPVWDKWIADREAKGLPAKRALADLYKIMTDEGQVNPIVGYAP